MAYSEKVLDHFQHPRRAGEIASADAMVEASNPVCGDVLKLWAVAGDGIITDLRFKAAGCVPAIACGSWVAEWALQKAIAALGKIPASEIEQGLGGLPAASRHASALAVDALRLLAEKLASSR